jgi:hypothetical protein
MGIKKGRRTFSRIRSISVTFVGGWQGWQGWQAGIGRKIPREDIFSKNGLPPLPPLPPPSNWCTKLHKTDRIREKVRRPFLIANKNDYPLWIRKSLPGPNCRFLAGWQDSGTFWSNLATRATPCHPNPYAQNMSASSVGNLATRPYIANVSAHANSESTVRNLFARASKKVAERLLGFGRFP